MSVAIVAMVNHTAITESDNENETDHECDAYISSNVSIQNTEVT